MFQKITSHKKLLFLSLIVLLIGIPLAITQALSPQSLFQFAQTPTRTQGYGSGGYNTNVYAQMQQNPTPTATLTPTTTPSPSITQPSQTPSPTITQQPTSTPSRTPTPTQVAPSPTPTHMVTSVPTTSVSQTPGNIILNLTALLHGIGKGGDQVSPGSNGNPAPQTPQPGVTIELYNSQGNLTNQIPGTLTYQPETGDFKGNVTTDTVSDGTYLVKIKSPKYLKTQAPGIFTLTRGQTTILPPLTLVVGDTNDDNFLDIIDYNFLLNCYSDLLPPKNCPTDQYKKQADLNDDGKVNALDYNLFLRNLSIRPGN